MLIIQITHITTRKLVTAGYRVKESLETCCGANVNKLVAICRRKLTFSAAKYSGPTGIDCTYTHTDLADTFSAMGDFPLH